MSSDLLFLSLRLEGPLQSWGFDSQYNHRNTGLFPTKSAIAGMCCAALGFGRGSEAEEEFLQDFRKLSMTSIAIPRKITFRYGKNERSVSLNVRRFQDYHTVQNTMRASGSINKECVLTYRQYLCDVSFGMTLSGLSGLLQKIATALENPIWGVWLGRKTCIPSAPVLAGLRESWDEALRLLIGNIPLENFTHQQDAETFEEGRDSLPDQPVSFAMAKRVFNPRRIITHQGRIPGPLVAE